MQIARALIIAGLEQIQSGIGIDRLHIQRGQEN